MDKRRVQLIGGSTYAISLPKDWARRVGLKKQVPVSLIAQMDGTIVIVPHAGDLDPVRKRTIEVSSRTPERSLARGIISSYLNGCDAITLISDSGFSSGQKEAIEGVQRKLVGLEIIEKSGDRYLLEGLIDMRDVDVWRGIARTHNVAAKMQEDAMEALVTDNPDLAKEAIDRDDDVDRLHFLNLRQLRKAASNPATSASLRLKPIECLDLQSVARRIEHIADHGEKMARNVLKLIGKLDGREKAELRLLNESAREIHEGAVRALLDGDLELANKSLNLRKDLGERSERFKQMLSKLEPNISVTLNSVIESLERIGDYGTDIAEVAINRAASEK